MCYYYYYNTIQIKSYEVAQNTTIYVFNLYVVEINECANSPCRNGATCTDAVNSYTCRCVAGYTGTHCEIGECLSIRMFYTYNGTIQLIIHLTIWWTHQLVNIIAYFEDTAK